MRRIKGFNPIQLLVVLVILMMTSILALQSSNVQNKLNKLNAASHDNVQWNLAQIEVELLVFLNALVTAQAQPDDAAHLESAKGRFDIFYSRVHSISKGGNFLTLKQHPSFATSMDVITLALDNATVLIDGDEATLRAGLGSLSEAMTALRGDARNLALVGVNIFANQADAQRAEFASLLKGTARTAFLLFIAMLVALYMMLHQRRLASMRARAARESRSRYISTIDASLDAIIVADADGKILEFNPAAEKIFGYSRARAVGADMSELIVPEAMREAHRAGMTRFRDKGERRVVGKGRVELTAIDASGREFPIEISIGTAETASDEPILISNIRDISKRKKIERELLDARDSAQAADQAKSRFLAVTSHEMRTPLNGVMGVLDLLSTTKLTDVQRDYLDTAVTSGEILQHHIDTVLDITRIEAGAIEIKPQRFDIDGLLEEVRQSYTITADKNWNTIELVVDDELDFVTLDRNRLRQILLNLVGNALKFTEYGLVRIRAGYNRSEDGKRILKFTVSDTGCGIAPENIKRIFDDFVTLDASYGRKTNGYGLGLSICRRITSAMNGDISVASTLNKGTTFTIQLPEANAVDMAPEEKNTYVISQETYDLDVLIVEDNETNRLIASAMLEQFGCRVTLAVDGEDGLKATASGSFDLV
ncbi:MAG: ATP-binding protein, partial [Ahrensia sp.]